jgi:hypothetical protein
LLLGEEPEEQKKKPEKKKNRDDSQPGKIFCWDADSGRIFAAFLQVYGIDLRTEKMHWWTFKTLFDALPADTKLMEVIQIRQKKIPGGKDQGEERNAIIRQQLVYRID